MKSRHLRFVRWSVVLTLGAVLAAQVGPAAAEQVSRTAVKDNTLFEYDPLDGTSPFHSNGIGDYFSAGRTKKNSSIYRGLIEFDLGDLPSDAVVVPGTATLRLEVIDVPRSDTSPRPFWLVALAGLNQPWGEGTSFADGGSGALATDGDATWLHTSYSTAAHDETTFIPDGPGYWSEMGALGNAPLDPQALYGDPEGIAGGTTGPLTLASAGMEADINNWLQDSTFNFGWIILGDETISANDASSKRGFASRENAIASYRPLLTFEYAVVPEPGSVSLLITGTIVALFVARRRRGSSAKQAARNRARQN